MMMIGDGFVSPLLLVVPCLSYSWWWDDDDDDDKEDKQDGIVSPPPPGGPLASAYSASHSGESHGGQVPDLSSTNRTNYSCFLSVIVCYCPCHCLCEGKCSQTSLLFIKQVVLWITLLFISLSSSCCAKTSSSARLKFVIANILRKKYVKKKNTGAANQVVDLLWLAW